MTKKSKRNIVYINEAKCDGCGLCIPSCVEGALQIVKGKAKLISDSYCDGLGVCIGQCPRDAIEIREREAEQFDEVATTTHKKQVQQKEKEDEISSLDLPENVLTKRPIGCPAIEKSAGRGPILKQWPIQLALISPNAPFFNKADILLVADCVPFTYADFHKEFPKDKVLLIACPKLDDFKSHQEKLTEILQLSKIKSITILHLDIPCCSGLADMAKQALSKSGKDVPLYDKTIVR
jgi:Pyruvate/2-oxoacid:ferredoxin oxidoreductase delta subunit